MLLGNYYFFDYGVISIDAEVKDAEVETTE